MSIWKNNTLEARKARWDALWALEDLPRPLWFVPADPMIALPAEYLGAGKSISRLYSDPDYQLAESLKFNKFAGRLQRFWARDDFIPRLQPLFGQGVFASAFGCQIEFPDHQMPVNRPLIEAGSPSAAVYELPSPGVHDGLLGPMLEMVERFNHTAGDQYTIAMTDLQGPIDTAYLIWNSIDFMLAMTDDPDAVHHLMAKVTDLIIAFVKEYKTRVRDFTGTFFPPAYLPDGMGIEIAEDMLALISSEHYETFSLPYVNRLSEEFGGIFIHSCGNIEHQLGVLGKVHNLRGLNFGVSETRFEAVWGALGGVTVLIPHCSSEMMVAEFRNAFDWVEHVLQIKTHNRGLALMIAPQIADFQDSKLAMALGKRVSFYDDLPGFAAFPFRIKRLLKRYA